METLQEVRMLRLDTTLSILVKGEACRSEGALREAVTRWLVEKGFLRGKERLHVLGGEMVLL